MYAQVYSTAVSPIKGICIREKLVNNRQFSKHLTYCISWEKDTAFLPKYLVKNGYTVNNLERYKWISLSWAKIRLSSELLSLTHPSSNPPENVSSVLKTYPESNAFSMLLRLTLGFNILCLGCNSFPASTLPIHPSTIYLQLRMKSVLQKMYNLYLSLKILP